MIHFALIGIDTLDLPCMVVQKYPTTRQPIAWHDIASWYYVMHDAIISCIDQTLPSQGCTTMKSNEVTRCAALKITPLSLRLHKNPLKDEVSCNTKADTFLPLHLTKVGSHIIFKVSWIMRAAAADRTEASNCCFYLGSRPCLSNPAGTTVTGGEKQEYRILASAFRLIGFEIEKPFVLLNFCHPGWPPSPQPARMTAQLWCSAAGVTMQPELLKNCFLLRAEHLVVRFSCLISCADVCEVDSVLVSFVLFF